MTALPGCICCEERDALQARIDAAPITVNRADLELAVNGKGDGSYVAAAFDRLRAALTAATPPDRPALDEASALRAENELWRGYSTWSCSRDHRTYPCGDCDGCRERGRWSVSARGVRLQARIDAALALCERDGYTTWDQKNHLPSPPWDPADQRVIEWERIHGHDVRLKCYAEYGCQLLIDPDDLRAALSPQEGT